MTFSSGSCTAEVKESYSPPLFRRWPELKLRRWTQTLPQVEKKQVFNTQSQRLNHGFRKNNNSQSNLRFKIVQRDKIENQNNSCNRSNLIRWSYYSITELFDHLVSQKMRAAIWWVLIYSLHTCKKLYNMNNIFNTILMMIIQVRALLNCLIDHGLILLMCNYLGLLYIENKPQIQY